MVPKTIFIIPYRDREYHKEHFNVYIKHVLSKLDPASYEIFFIHQIDNRPFNDSEMNLLFNSADVYINLASNEGFGLGSCEALTVGTPIIVNVTGGLQDQCGFKVDGKYLTADDYKEIGSLHDWRKWEDKVTHGEWVKPVWSRVQTMTGSVPTPYIIDDKVDVTEVSEAIRYWYDKGDKGRKKAGKAGRNAFINEIGLGVDTQNKTMGDGIEKAIKNFKPKKRFNLYKLA